MAIQDAVTRAFKRTDDIIDSIGPRLAGSKASLDAANELAKEMETFTDDVQSEHFFVYKGAFLGWIRILVSAYLIGTIMLWLSYPIITAALLLTSILILILQFFLYQPLLDRLYPKRTGMNVVGTIEPTGVPTRQIILSGHHDSARIFNFFIHQPKLYNLRVTGGIGLVVFLLLVSIFQIVTAFPMVDLILNIVVSVGFLLTGQMWFFASKKGTPGAGDNLIASNLAIEIGRHFAENKLTQTRIIVASFDAEEEGLRGARAFAKAHKEALQKIPTTLLNVDCPYELDELFFLTSDINGSVQLSSELAEDLASIAKAKGYPATTKPIAFLTGGTDAAELAKVGVKATTLLAMPWSNNERASVYHTPNDTTDAIEEKVIYATIDIFQEYISNQDK